MNTKLLTGTLGAMLLFAPFGWAQDDQKPSPTAQAKTTRAKKPAMSEDMARAIAWERAKDRAAARQAAIEARRSRTEQNANRTMDDRDPGRKVKDTGASGAKREQ